MEKWKEAREFALKVHGDQKYGNGEPYIVHLDDVASVLREFGYESDLFLILAYLHDVLEDTDTTPEDIRREFGESEPVASGVLFLTDEQGPDRKTRKGLTYALRHHTLQSCANDIGIRTATRVKLADRIANLRRSVGTSYMEMYLKERDAFRATYHCAEPDDKMWAEYEFLMNMPSQPG